MARQSERLLDWFTRWKSITPLEAQQQLGIGRLGARVFDLRAAGHDIHTERLNVPNRFGETTRPARYHYRGRISPC